MILFSDVWIGLNDKFREGLYSWSDGSLAEFTAWGGGQPGRPRDDEDCVKMDPYYTWAWKIFRCQHPNAFICELGISFTFYLFVFLITLSGE